MAAVSDHDWRLQLDVGSLVDASDTTHNWLPAKVVNIKISSDNCTFLLIHCKKECMYCYPLLPYIFSCADLTWASSWDEWIDSTSDRLAPFHSPPRSFKPSNHKLPLTTNLLDVSRAWDDYLDDARVLALLDVDFALCWFAKKLADRPFLDREPDIKRLVQLKANPTLALAAGITNSSTTNALLKSGADVNRTQAVLRSLFFHPLGFSRNPARLLLHHHATVFVPIAPVPIVPGPYDIPTTVEDDSRTESVLDCMERHVANRHHMYLDAKEACLHYMISLVTASDVFETVVSTPDSTLRSRSLLNMIWEYVFADPWQLVSEQSQRVRHLVSACGGC